MATQTQKDLLLAAASELAADVTAAVRQVRDVFGEVLEPGQRVHRELLRTPATPSVTARNVGEVVAELKRSGDIVAGRERGCPLYWQRTPAGIDPVEP